MQGIQILRNGSLAGGGEGVARVLCLRAEDGVLFQGVQGLVQKIVSVGDALCLVIVLFFGGQVSVIIRGHAELLIHLGLLPLVADLGVVIIGELGDGEFLISHGGGHGVFLENAGIPDQQRGYDDAKNDANDQIQLGLGLLRFVSIICAHDDRRFPPYIADESIFGHRLY